MPSHEKITTHMVLLACKFVMCMIDSITFFRSIVFQSITFFDNVPFQCPSIAYPSAVLQQQVFMVTLHALVEIVRFDQTEKCI